ncbi:MAG TPA: MG2 domain-containing protein [Saprospiraceae bacterium]|nr:MG2 domain-containing protein [Saprospiraceae bacterium]
MLKNQLFILFLSGLFILSCQRNNEKVLSKPSQFSQYIVAYSENKLERKSKVSVTFSSEITKVQNSKEKPLNKIASISPNLPGEFQFSNLYTLDFVPSERNFKGSDQFYLTVNMKELWPEIADSLAYFTFPFSFHEKQYSVQTSVIQADLQNVGKLKLSGTIKANDKLELKELEKSFEIKDEISPAPSIQFNQLSDEDFEFTVENIGRTENDRLLVLNYRSRLEFPELVESSSFHVPSKNKFVVTGTQVEEEEANSVKFYFSDILDQQQQFKECYRFKQNLCKLSHLAGPNHLTLNWEDTCDLRAAEIVLSNIKAKDSKLKFSEYQYVLATELDVPQIKILASESARILPYTSRASLPIQTINLKAFDVEVFKIFSNNILPTMHLLSLESYSLNRVGRIFSQYHINLDKSQVYNNKKYIYNLDLSKIVKQDLSAMYEIRLTFKPQDAILPCVEQPQLPEFSDEDNEESDEDFHSNWVNYYPYDYRSEEEYPDSDNPCNYTYYTSSHFDKKTILVSDLALSFKAAKDAQSAYASVNLISTADAVKGATVKFYDKQLQLIQQATTDGNGIVLPSLSRSLAFVVAEYNQQSAFLEVSESNTLSLSEFDVEGVKSKHGLKAYLFGERGVWRPGDTILYNVMLAQDGKEIPGNFPIQCKLYNPKSQIVFQNTINDHKLGYYSFVIPTNVNAITGNYTMKVVVGASIFEQTVKIENIKPNRLKADWTLPVFAENANCTGKFKLKANWLHGAPASNMKYDASVYYRSSLPNFKAYQDFSWISYEKERYDTENKLSTGKLNENGEAEIPASGFCPPLKCGMLKVNIRTEIVPEGGDVNTDYFDFDYAPFTEYVGVKVADSPISGYITDKVNCQAKIIVLDKSAKPVSNRDLNVELFHVNWSWWYSVTRSSYDDKNFYELSKSYKVRTNGNGEAVVKLDLSTNFDNYYIRVTNTKNNYVAGQYFYSSWYHDLDESNQADLLSKLKLKTDKELYQVGEKVTVNLPAGNNAKYLISVVKQDRILKSYTVNADRQNHQFDFVVEENMIPNVYLDVQMIQGFQNKKNDLPLRLYGVVPVQVESSSRKLLPQLQVSERVKPGESFSVEISEQKGEMMAYQIFLVDEGLLNLTRFKTPNPYQEFFAKEAFLLNSWDSYQQIIDISQYLNYKNISVGGDKALSAVELDRIKRFKPIVLHSGVQLLKKNEKRKHEFKVSNYYGALRAMVVAVNSGKYGNQEKMIEVSEDLMAQMSFPRVTSVLDEVKVPVHIFVNQKNIQSVNVEAISSGALKLVGLQEQTVQFSNKGEKIVYFTVKASELEGQAELKVIASSGASKSEASVQTMVLNPNPVSTKANSFWVEPGQTIQQNLPAYGMQGTRNVSMELSLFKGININQYLSKLIHYPHGCLEQLTSGAFPQLMLMTYQNLTIEQKTNIQTNVQSAIDKINSYRDANNRLNYWQHGSYYYSWAHVYAVHFLLEAKKQSFKVPEELVKYCMQTVQSEVKVRSSKLDKDGFREMDIQAYSLYVLSLAGNVDWAAMNRLKEMPKKTGLATFLLAATYYKNGQKDLAEKMITNVEKTSDPYSYYTFGSQTRDDAMIAMCLVDMDKKKESAELINSIGEKIEYSNYLSTQEMSMILLSISKIMKNYTNLGLNFDLDWNGEKLSKSGQIQYYSQSLSNTSNGKFIFTNKNSAPVLFSIIQSGKLLNKDIESSNKVLNIKVEYTPNGKSNGVQFKVGDEINAVVTVSNDGTYGKIDRIALTSIFPSGFEIRNDRLSDFRTNENEDYRDIRDDRVMDYFSLDKRQSRSFIIPLLVSYPGKYPSPMFYTEAMYHPAYNAVYKKSDIEIKE